MTAAGWYQDPMGPGQRFFDGSQWTAHTAPHPQPVAVLPHRTNHALHLLLTILTFPLCGGWLWVWIFVAMSNSGKTQTVYR